MDARTRQGPPCDGAGGLEQALDLADRAAGVLALGGENRRLDGGREFRLAAIGPHRGDQSVEAASAVAVIPPLDRLLPQRAPVGTGNDVLASSQLTQDLLQLAPRQPSLADQRTQDREAKQRLRIDFVHGDSS